MHLCVTRECVTIPGPRGMLSGELAYGDGAVRGSVLLLSPHPHMGGTMENRLVAELASAIAEAGWVSLRFAYGTCSDDELAESMLAFWQTGEAPEDPRLIDEARAARDWLAAQVEGQLALVGYSFGAHAAVEILDDTTAAIATIAPTVRQHGLGRLRWSPVPKLVVYSSDDFATPALTTESWFGGLAEPRRKVCLFGAEHFFKHREAEVADVVTRFLGGVHPAGRSA